MAIGTEPRETQEAVAQRARACAMDIVAVLKKHRMAQVIQRIETCYPNGNLDVKFGLDYVPATSAQLIALEESVRG